jgi:hypothetical protein
MKATNKTPGAWLGFLFGQSLVPKMVKNGHLLVMFVPFMAKKSVGMSS